MPRTLNRIRRSRKLLFTLFVLVVALAVGYLALRILGNRIDDELMSAKMYRGATVTVAKKEVIKFDEKNHSYVSELGHRIEVPRGVEQYRVYFYFDEFNGYDEPFRSQLTQAEKQRISEERPHYKWTNYNDRSWYDTVNVGDKLRVSYKAFSDSAIEVLEARKFDH
jgi:hypothetical protein